MRLLAVALLAASSACALGGMDDPSADEQESGSTVYIDIRDFEKIDATHWYELVRKLNAEVAAEDATHRPLTFFCSVTSKRGDIKDCAWTFASADVAIDGATAAISTNAPTFECHVAPKLTAARLILQLASAPNALHAPLPGSGPIADSLAACFANPIGATPVPSVSPSTYIAASDYYTTPTHLQTWRDAQTALVAGFDRVCGDTFCSGDMADLLSLSFECAITKSTGNVKGCAWTFGGSYTLVARDGALDLTSGTFTCPVAMHGTLAQLISTLTGPGTEDAIRRALPGTTATPYDALLGCLP